MGFYLALCNIAQSKMLRDHTNVEFSTFNGQSLKVNRYFLQIFNGFYRDILKAHNDVDALIFYHEDMSLHDLEQFAVEINTRHENCGGKSDKDTPCDDISVGKVLNMEEDKNTFDSQCDGVNILKNENFEEEEKLKVSLQPNSSLTSNLACPLPCTEADKEKQWTADDLFAHLHIKHYKELKTNFSISIGTLLTKLLRSVSNLCAYGCNSKLASTTNLISHYKHKHIVDPRICSHCGKTYQNKSKLNEHTSRFAVQDKSINCEICNKVFGNPHGLKIHMKNTHLKKRFSCSHLNCTVSVPDSYQLKRHIKMVHEKQKLLVCDVCGVSMAKFINLKAHRMKVHQMEQFTSIHHYREIISSGNHPFIKKDSPQALAVYN